VSRSLAKYLSNSVEVLDNQGVTHLFSHVELVDGLDVGSEVKVGDDLYRISYNSGDSTAPHLHYSAFEMMEGGDGQKICQPVPLVDAGESEVQLYRTNLPGFDRYIRSENI
jgi:murein DD-endopeptidase MepM/ murein hydrolase activator NlpD